MEKGTGKSRPPAGETSFRVEGVYFPRQDYRCVTFSNPDEAPKERELTFAWDWRFSGPGRLEVKVELKMGPSTEFSEAVSLVGIGAFSIMSGLTQDHLLGFVKVSAPAFVFPYLREALTSLTSKGPYGPVLLSPMNVSSLTADFDPKKTTGWQQLEEDSELLVPIDRR